MRFVIRTTLCLISLALASSCADDPVQDEGGKITVTIGSTPDIDVISRTAIDPEGVATRWIEGDQIALWARTDAGIYALEAQPFSLWHYNQQYNSARFTSTVGPMEEGSYTYYASSPVPESCEGTTATYTIPSTQDGSDRLACDVMVAAPLEGLGALRQGDNSDVIDLRFTHKIHVLKIRIPENLMGQPITRLDLTFPVAVTGKMSVDISAPEAAPQLEAAEDGKVLTLEFAEPKDAGDVVFAVIAPTELTPDDPITFKAYAGLYESYPVTMPGKNFLAAHTTPIALTIPRMHLVTRFTFSLTGDAVERIGQPLTAFTIEAPEGVDLGNGTNRHTFDCTGAESYELAIEGELTDTFSGKDYTVRFETQDAELTRPFRIESLILYANNRFSPFEVPYLLFEDFSGIVTFDNNCDVGTGTDSGSSGNKDAIQLAQYGTGEGWTASRVGGEAGIAIRSSCRFEGGGAGKLTSYATYPGRIDSAPINNGKNRLKNPVRVQVQFDYTGGQDSWMMDKNASSGGTYGNPVLAYGYTTNTGAPNGGSDLENTVESGIALDTDKSWTSPFATKTFYIDDFTDATRLSWKVTVNRVGGSGWTGIYGANGNHYFYLDNVKVLIAQ